MSAPPTTAKDYIARMRDPVKQRYAAEYWAWLCAGGSTPAPHALSGTDPHAIHKQLWKFRTEAADAAYRAKLAAERAAREAEVARLAARPLAEKLKDETHADLTIQANEAICAIGEEHAEGGEVELAMAIVLELERRLDEAPDAEDLARMRADEKTVEELSDYLDGETEGPAIVARVTRDAERLDDLLSFDNRDRGLVHQLMAATRALYSADPEHSATEAREALEAVHALERWLERNR